ncbi:hypothetical protein M7I_0805 [Glarea lozoyensis 74030]|uniref:Aminoglycoside phosphotransferase domain-containing protein n=1 Tax=Glarea lozoyensis (strain ATCC 74030 / MF5533) TaxID=1104152 RepID=H0EED0_GLAL7|nr:hypothetical protein M7I_0805 [Glarea lozoyensis 74030]
MFALLHRELRSKETKASATKVVIRISNPQALLNEDVRVQNEVAAMCLARQALSTYGSRLIPHTYAWQSSEEGYGWILQEYMEGVPLDKEMNGLNSDRKQDILHQIANVFKLIQNFSLPESVKGYGGLTFNDSGEIVTGPTTIPCGGPFTEFHEIKWDQKVVIENSVARQTLVHGDFNTFNMLFDPSSNLLTALLDFDLSHIATPADEYFYSFRTLGALLAGPFEPGDEGQLRQYLLYGNVPAQNGTKVDFEVAQMMDKEFVRAGVLRPADIPGAGELAALKWFLEDVSPPYFFMERWLEWKGREKVEEIKVGIEETLGGYLERWGF